MICAESHMRMSHDLPDGPGEGFLIAPPAVLGHEVGEEPRDPFHWEVVLLRVAEEVEQRCDEDHLHVGVCVCVHVRVCVCMCV